MGLLLGAPLLMFGIELNDLQEISGFDGVILAVPHTCYLDIPRKNLAALLSTDGIFIDVKAIFDKDNFPETVTYWSL